MEVFQFAEQARERLSRLEGSAQTLRAGVKELLAELEDAARDPDLAELNELTRAWIAGLTSLDDDLASYVARLQDGLDTTRR
jgi:hypothetical protein